jgi:hypothetical protein
MLEYAQAVWRIDALHAETNPEAEDPLIAPLMCSLVEVRGGLTFEPGSRLRAIYGRDSANEEYHCNYGFNPRYASRLQSGPLKVAARDDDGSVRAVELDEHPFFHRHLVPARARRVARANAAPGESVCERRRNELSERASSAQIDAATVTFVRGSAAAAPRRRAPSSPVALCARSAIVRATFSTRSELRALNCQRSAARFSSARCSAPSFTTRHNARESSRALRLATAVELVARAATTLSRNTADSLPSWAP